MTKLAAKPTSAPDGANRTILSGARTLDGISEDAATIPTVSSAADRRSDSVGKLSESPPVAPPARTSRRGFLMNTIVSVASLATAAAVATPPIASIVPMETIDPIFAVITAHRSAHDELNKAVTAADVSPVRRTATPSARVMVGLKDVTESSWTETGGGGFTLIVTPTGRKEPVYALSSAQIRDNVPKELQGDARQAWIADREAELEAAEQRIAKRRARTKIGKLEAARDKAYDLERDRMWDIIWTMPTTVEGLAALLRYCRERESINELVADDEWEDALEWTMECAACALANLPKPAMSNVVAMLCDAAEAFDPTWRRPSGVA
jgi:hypothetical protein